MRSLPRWTGLMIVVVVGLPAVATAWGVGARLDYRAYLEHWDLVLRGEDPWVRPDGTWTSNAYGPAFLLLAWLVKIHPLVGKLLFTFLWLSLSYWLLELALRAADGAGWRIVVAASVLAGPFFWIQVPIYSHFDIAVAACSLLAIHFHRRGHDALAGALLGVGILLKFMPIVFLPFLAWKSGRIRARLLLGGLGLPCAGLLLSIALWGKSPFAPVLLMTRRGAGFNSIYLFVEKAVRVSCVAWSTPLVAIAIGAIVLAFLRGRLDALAACVLTALVTVLFYRLGHLQFFVTPVLLTAYWLISCLPGAALRSRILIPCVAWYGWLSILQSSYLLTRGFRTLPSLFWLCGLPTFVLTAWLVFSLARSLAHLASGRAPLYPPPPAR